MISASSRVWVAPDKCECERIEECSVTIPDAIMATKDAGAVHVYLYWDNSNIFLSARHCSLNERSDAKYRLRIDFANLVSLAVANRPVKRALAVGSIPPELEHVWKLMAAQGVDVKCHHRAQGVGEQQATDEKLQLQMLRDLVANVESPGTAVVLTGDGAGFLEGMGFWATLQSMKRFGWGVEVLSWSESCHKKIRRWVEEKGVFVELDHYYPAITFLESGQLPGELPRHALPLDLKGRMLALPGEGRIVAQYEPPARAFPTTEDWDAN